MLVSENFAERRLEITIALLSIRGDLQNVPPDIETCQAYLNCSGLAASLGWNRPFLLTASLSAFWKLWSYLFTAIPNISKCAPRSNGPEPTKARAGYSLPK